MKQIFAFLGVVVIISSVILYSSMQRVLPVFNPANLSSTVVDTSLHDVQQDHTVGEFSLIDQNGNIVDSRVFEGKIYIASFFFTTCPTICIDMNKNLLLIQDKLDSQTMILSHSVTPEYDTPEVLNQYALARGIRHDKWRLTTGEKSHIYDLARKAYFAAKIDNSEFVHTESLVLVDPDKRLRGFYKGTDIQEMKRLLSDIKILQNEYQ